MTPSDAVYHRVLWDPRFDPARWVLGVEVRAEQPKRVPLVDFVPGGDLPWHRVLFFEADGVVVWDRRTGIDQVETTSHGRAHTPSALPETFDRRPVLRWDDARWKSTIIGEDTPRTSLRVATWNLLFDRYDDGSLRSAERRDLLVRALDLEASRRDVLALQEVQWSLLERLLDLPSFREGAVVLPGPVEGVDDHGLVLWSRVPICAAGFLTFERHKGALASRVEGPTGPLLLVTTHLTSDHSKGAAERRAGQLATLRDALDATTLPAVVLGDFNDASDGPPAALGLRDLGLDHAIGSVATFDPARNPLARIGSRTGAALRLDRVLASGELGARSAQLLGTEPDPSGLYPSDHFGVAMELVSAPRTAHATLPHDPDVHTALCWLPPSEVQRLLEPVRRAHDPAFDRWPAHVNLRFGFVPEHAFDEAAEMLRQALEPVSAVPVALSTLQHWPARKAGRKPVWSLDPTSEAPQGWRALEQAIAPCLPALRPGRPHLTLSRGSRPVLPPLPNDLVVDALHLVSRRDDGPMELRATVPLGGGPVRWHDPPGPDELPLPDAGSRDAVDGTVQALTRAVEAVDGELHVVGSWGMGVALASSDLDLVAVLPEGSSSPLVDDLLGAWPGRRVTGARVPGVKLDVRGLPVDLALVEVSSVREAVDRRGHESEAVQRALAGVADAKCLAAAFRDPSHRRLARIVKLWARARGLDQRPLGGLPPVGWLVLVAHALQRRPATGLVDLFDTMAASLEGPVSLHGGWPGDPDLPLQVGVPAPPYRPCSDAVTTAMARRIRDELVRAWMLTADDAPLSALTAPVPWHRQHVAHLVFEPDGADAAGRLRGQIRALLAELEAIDAHDAHAVGDPDGRVRIGLGRTPPPPSSVDELLPGWRARLVGVQVRLHR